MILIVAKILMLLLVELLWLCIRVKIGQSSFYTLNTYNNKQSQGYHFPNQLRSY